MAKSKAMSDDELLALLEGHINQAVGHEDGELSRERRDVLDHYRGEKPLKSKRGSSSYVSTDVYDAVEAMHAQLLETFSAGHKLVRFAPQGPEDVYTADCITEYVDYVINRQNKGYEILSDTIKDGLMFRHGVTKVWWEDREETVEEEISAPISEAALGQLALSHPDADFSGLEEVAPGMYQGTVKAKVKSGQVRLAVVPPHEFLAAPKSRNLETAPFVAHRTLKSRSELLALGLSKKEVDEVMATGTDYEDAFDNIEDNQRFKGLDDGVVEMLDEAWRRVWLYECYLRGDLDGSGEDALWFVQKVADKVLRREKVKRHPFVIFTPIRMPHSLWGANYAQRVIPSQNSKTVLMRAILDHTAVTVNPRYLVMNGSIQNPNQLMDQRLGGMVVANRPDAVQPLVQPPLNPFVFQALQLLDADMEDTTGISRLSQGLNKDAVSKQNSAALIEQLTTNSQTRQKVIARNFANNYLIPLYQLVADLVVENEAPEKIIQVCGQWQPVDPKTWGERRDVVAEVHLGYGEQDREVQKWLMLHQLLASDPMIGSLYGYDRRFNLYKKVFELKGVKDIATYLPPPEQAQPQPDPNQQMQAQMLLMEMQLKQRKQALEEQKFQLEAQLKMQELGIDKAQLALDAEQFRQEHALDIRKQAHDEAVDNAEVEVMKREAATKQLTAIASPNS